MLVKRKRKWCAALVIYDAGDLVDRDVAYEWAKKVGGRPVYGFANHVRFLFPFMETRERAIRTLADRVKSQEKKGRDIHVYLKEGSNA